MVAKRASLNEIKAYQILREKGAPIPPVYQVIPGSDATYMLFMKMMPGTELYSISNEKSWILAAEKLAQIHLAFWHDNAEEKKQILISPGARSWTVGFKAHTQMFMDAECGKSIWIMQRIVS